MRGSRLRSSGALAIGLLWLTACVGVSEPPAAPPSLVCPPLVEYSAEEREAVAQAVEALPEGSPLVGLVDDYLALREMVRACGSG